MPPPRLELQPAPHRQRADVGPSPSPSAHRRQPRPPRRERQEVSTFLSHIAFAYPVALWSLLLLPAIWWLLRFTPPRPQSVRFPPLRLLLDLVSREEESDRTPWWLMLIRLALAGLLILAVAQPVLAPGQRLAGSSAPLLLVIDDGWAAAKDWNRRQDVIAELIASARNGGAPVVLAPTTPHLQAPALTARDAQQAIAEASRLAPQALATDRMALLKRLEAQYAGSPALTIVWIADGIDAGSARSFADGLKGLAGGGAQVEAVVPETSTLAMAL
ncbi:MAG: hypothetical protein FJX63_04060, partial [Alphaproteobacteria bacterium]|nr:hypothetical protein [Alphaproteobacteria bacterium]